MNVTAALSGCTKKDMVVLLAHQPSAAKVAIESPMGDKIDLVLSGKSRK